MSLGVILQSCSLLQIVKLHIFIFIPRARAGAALNASDAAGSRTVVLNQDALGFGFTLAGRSDPEDSELVSLLRVVLT